MITKLTQQQTFLDDAFKEHKGILKNEVTKEDFENNVNIFHTYNLEELNEAFDTDLKRMQDFEFYDQFDEGTWMIVGDVFYRYDLNEDIIDYDKM